MAMEWEHAISPEYTLLHCLTSKPNGYRLWLVAASLIPTRDFVRLFCSLREFDYHDYQHTRSVKVERLVFRSDGTGRAHFRHHQATNGQRNSYFTGRWRRSVNIFFYSCRVLATSTKFYTFFVVVFVSCKIHINASLSQAKGQMHSFLSPPPHQKKLLDFTPPLKKKSTHTHKRANKNMLLEQCVCVCACVCMCVCVCVCMCVCVRVCV